MKHLFYSLIVQLFTACMCISCQNDADVFNPEERNDKVDYEEFSVSDGEIEKPKWLAEVVDSVAASHQLGEGIIYPWVCYVFYNETKYYLICDPLTSIWGHFYYTLSGERIPNNSGLYSALESGGNSTLLWRQGQ